MQTPLEVIADAMDEDLMMYQADHQNALAIIAALDAAGYEITPKSTGDTKMVEPTKLKTKDDYSEHVVTKMVDGNPVECVVIDAMTEDQWKRYCRETGTEYFQRLSITI